MNLNFKNALAIIGISVFTSFISVWGYSKLTNSNNSFENDGKLRLLPIAMMRYWAMFMVGNGIALEDGMRGNVIRISNSSSKKVIQGVVRSSEIVEISMPSQSGILSQVSQ